jgi:murein DD-endopeptidase MepM/ murein hydrolase activator NlpD
LAKKTTNKYISGTWWYKNLTLVIRDSYTLEEIRQISYTPFIVLLIGLGLSLPIFMVGFWIASFVYSPKSTIGKDETTRKLVEMNLTIDSLAQDLKKKNDFIENLQKLVQGDVAHMKDAGGQEKQQSTTNNPQDTSKHDHNHAHIHTKKVNKDSVNIDKLSASDKKLRQEIESGDKGFVGIGGGNNIDLQNIFLFNPLKGLITEKYNAKEKHFGIDIVAEKDAPIKSVNEGTVIMASWTDDTGYVMMIQHASKLISVYKHCSVLLKKTGDFVQTGEIIAIIGNTGALTSGAHLHFELWYEGSSLNPEKMISF